MYADVCTFHYDEYMVQVFTDPTDISVKEAAFSQFAKNNIGTGVDPKYYRNQ